MWWDSETDYLSWLPDIWHRVQDVQVLASVVNEELDALKREIKRLVTDKIPQTASLRGVRRWEKILNLNAPIQDDLPYRRQEIVAKLKTKPPINVDTLRNVIETYLGVPVNILLHEPAYHVKVTYRGETKLPTMEPLYKKLYDTIPANLLINIAYAYVTWGEVSTMTWGEASSKTWDELRKGT